VRHKRTRCRAAEERDELAAFQLIELHLVANPAGTARQNSKVEGISQLGITTSLQPTCQPKSAWD
jgi:hypothetical protein